MLDAMACGLPVVATDVGEIGSIVEPDVHGYLVQPGDVTGLCEALERLLSDEELRLRLGDQAADRVRAEASVGAIALRYRSLFASVDASREPARTSPAGTASK